MPDWDYFNRLIDMGIAEQDSARDIFDVNHEVIEYFKKWRENHHSFDIVAGQSVTSHRLGFSWIQIIKEYLQYHPKTREKFLNLMTDYDWVRNGSKDSLKIKILEELVNNGIKFSALQWNKIPTQVCLRGKFSWEEAAQQLIMGKDVTLLENNTIEGCCPLLHIKLYTHKEFIPARDGDHSLPASKTNNVSYPLNTIINDKVRGFVRLVIDHIDAYCGIS